MSQSGNLSSNAETPARVHAGGVPLHIYEHRICQTGSRRFGVSRIPVLEEITRASAE
jgi:hypothetical protein